MSPDVAASVKGVERLLYRLGASPVRQRCLLKGASLLSVWLADPYRATRDVDLLAFGASDDGAVRTLLEEICTVPCPEDGLRFDLAEMSVEAIRPEEFAGKRARFMAYLGRARITVQIDIGFGDAIGARPRACAPTRVKQALRRSLRPWSSSTRETAG